MLKSSLNESTGIYQLKIDLEFSALSDVSEKILKDKAIIK
jgi:hypothetical protein